MKKKLLILAALVLALIVIGSDALQGGFGIGGGIQIGGQIYQGQIQAQFGKVQPRPAMELEL